MIRSLPVLGLLLLGCATAGTKPAAQQQITAEQVDPARAAKGDKLICTMERPTGSNLPEQVCRWASDKQQVSDEARDALRRGLVQRERGN